jgi:hypothetical protein
MVKIIEDNSIGSMLKIVIEKCLTITEDWHHDVNLIDFEKAKKLALMGETPESQRSK